MKVECTWGDGPDVLLSLEGTKLILYNGPILSDPSEGGYRFGHTTDGSIDLTADEALSLAAQLEIAAQQVKYLEALCREHDKLEEENEDSSCSLPIK